MKEQHNRMNTSESQRPQDSTGVLEISGNLLIFWYNLSFAVCEDPRRFWRGSFRVPKQLSPPQQANALGRAFPGPEACGPKHGRVGWVIAMTATRGRLGIRGSDGSGEGPTQALLVPSAAKCTKRSPGRCVFTSYQ